MTHQINVDYGNSRKIEGIVEQSFASNALVDGRHNLILKLKEGPELYWMKDQTVRVDTGERVRLYLYSPGCPEAEEDRNIINVLEILDKKKNVKFTYLNYLRDLDF